jgi:AcrR family transcriptional regulator
MSKMEGWQGESRRVGRPPRIDRAAIARAVLEIGFEDVTMKRVAEHLGVSVPGLYHYVRGRDDLIRVAAEYRLSEVERPRDHGQHWALWLREWARFIRAAMALRPELVESYLSSGLHDDRMIDVIGGVLDSLEARGFSPQQAMGAWDTVATVALGAAVEDIRERGAGAAGRPWIARVYGTLARRGANEQRTFRALLASGYEHDLETSFEAKLTTMVSGIAVTMGLPLDPEVTRQ